MDISYIDNLSHNIKSPLHQASAFSKVCMIVMIIAAVIISTNPVSLVISLSTVILGLILSKLPLKILGFTAYAFFFSLIFAISEIGASWHESLTIILKSVTAASALLLLISTTPYPQIFGFLRVVLPSAVVDVMLITYRSLFILFEEIQHRLTAMKIRGSTRVRDIMHNLRSIGIIIGFGVIHAWDLSEKMEYAMYVRGYNGRLSLSNQWRNFNKYDVYPVIIGIISLMAAIKL